MYFRNVPVGCTATILYQMYQEQDLTPSKEIAGLLLSAILSDTLMFRSPTSTPQDEATAKALAEIAGEDIPTYAEQMFEAGADLTGRTAAAMPGMSSAPTSRPSAAATPNSVWGSLSI